MHFHWKLIWFGKIWGSSTVDSPRSPKRLSKMHFVIENMHKTLIYDGLGRASWESRGIDRAESTVRKMARKDQISLQSVLFFKKMARGNIDFAWEWHRFGIFNSKNAWEWHRFDAKTLESGIVFELGVSISLKKCIVFDPQIAKTLESGIVFDVSGEPRAASGASGSLGGPSTTTTTHLEINIPPPHHAQEKNTS